MTRNGPRQSLDRRANVIDADHPRDLEAERALIGSCLLNPGLLRHSDVRLDLFAEPLHRDIFKVLSRMETAGEQIDCVTAYDAFRRTHGNDRITADYLPQCTFLAEQTVAPALIRILSDYARRREIGRTAQVLRRVANDPQEDVVLRTGEAIDRLEQLRGNNGQGDQTKDRSFSSFMSYPWPTPPATEAFHGLAGDIVRIISPASEADPTALLVQLLLGFGNMIGRGPYYLAEADQHATNEFAILVGETAKGRKGSSFGRARQLLDAADTSGWRDRVTSGASSGEGIIWHVRDPISKQEKVKEKDKPARYEEVCTDQGSDDKRLFLLEPEFASVLSVMARQGNTLSAILRKAWDSGDISALTKNSPAKTTGALISLVGHVTADELRRSLN